MRILLDTQAFLWWIEGTRVGAKARTAIVDRGDELLLCLASIWEIEIKVGLGKLKMPKSFEQYIPHQLHLNRIAQLDINFRHVARGKAAFSPSRSIRSIDHRARFGGKAANYQHRWGVRQI